MVKSSEGFRDGIASLPSDKLKHQKRLFTISKCKNQTFESDQHHAEISQPSSIEGGSPLYLSREVTLPRFPTFRTPTLQTADTKTPTPYILTPEVAPSIGEPPDAALRIEDSPSPRWQTVDGRLVISPSEHYTSLSQIEWGTLPLQATTIAPQVSSDDEETPRTIKTEPQTPAAPLNCRSLRSFNSNSTRTAPIPFFTPTSKETPSTIASPSTTWDTPSRGKPSQSKTSKLYKRLSWSQQLEAKDVFPNNYQTEFEMEYTSGLLQEQARLTG